MKCVKCNKNHNGTYGSGRFCSISCANSRVRSDVTKKLISAGVKRHLKNGGSKGGIINMTPAAFELWLFNKRKNSDIKLLSAPFENLNFFSIKHRILLEQNFKCNQCKIDRWRGKIITLELEHINGIRSDNRRENLECLCPNCHSLTPTWRGRNKLCVTNKNKISDIDICRTFLQKGNIRQTLLSLGLAAKGANYGRVKKALTLHNIKYN